MVQTAQLVRLDGVCKSYPSGGAEGKLPVLRDIQLEVAAGQSVAILGPSGSGKSTLLNIIGTLDYAEAGRVLIDGRDVSGMGEDDLASLRRQRIGFVFQSHHLLPHCTVWENVLLPTLACKGDQAKGREEPLSRAERLLKRVDLGERLAHRPGQLSGGERQRVAVVRALILGPGLLLADEPTGSLDRESAESLGHLLMELNREEGVALVVVTHALTLANLMQRQYELRDRTLKEAQISPA
jgi:lipoprotein-releasing system ATP-binding protein